MRRVITGISILFVFCIWIFADVRVEFPGTFVGPGNINGPEPYMYNTTSLKIDLAGWRFLGERLGIVRVIGAVIIFAGILTIALFG